VWSNGASRIWTALGIVEVPIGAEVHMQPLRQRCEALHALRAVEERGRAGDDQVEPRIASGVDLVDPLPQRVQALLAGVGAHALQRFHLVQHHHQAGEAAVAQDGQQADEKVGGAEVIQVTLDARRTLDAAATFGCPASQLISPSASMPSPAARARR
jgi:hypothetical protein